MNSTGKLSRTPSFSGAQVEAELSYLQQPKEDAFMYMYDPPEAKAQGNCEFENRGLVITDARKSVVAPTLDAEGFGLWDAPSQVHDFWDEDAIRSIYYSEASELACLVTGATKAYVFDHMLRKRENGRPVLAFGRSGDGRQPGAAGRIHNDYSESSGRKKLALVISDSNELAGVERYSIINIWRSIGGPVVDTPLALCDAQTISTLDMVNCEVRRPDRVGEIYLTRYSPRHQWYYYAHMDRHEALVFKQFDSQINGTARIVPHTAFDLPNIPRDAPLRESIEVRCLVVY